MIMANPAHWARSTTESATEPFPLQTRVGPWWSWPRGRGGSVGGWFDAGVGEIGRWGQAGRQRWGETQQDVLVVFAVERIAAAFRAHCEVIDEHRHAAVLTYRESGTLSPEGRNKIKQMEIDTSEPLRNSIRSGVDSGQLVDVDVELAAHDFLLMAHGWALKHWHLERTMQFEDYVTKQTALLLSALLEPECRSRYEHLLAPG